MSVESRPKKILLGVCGSIASYKAADLVSRLKEAGFEVRVVMTSSATQFITPLTLATLSGNPVGSDLWKEDIQGTEHIRLARWADYFLIAPLTANTLSKLAHGMADDWITSIALATRAPLLIAPAMNTVMWDHPATQSNLHALLTRGATLIPPAEGVLACGESGQGKLPDVSEIVKQVHNFASRQISTSTQDFLGQTVLITSGPTRSFIDSVRYMTNPSTGKMGSALALAALNRGARVIYVSGQDKGVEFPVPTTLEQKHRLTVIKVDTAEEMLQAALPHLNQASGVIATAAVLDYRFDSTHPQKLKRSSEAAHLTLVPSVDVLAGLRSQASPGQWFVGFAAETENFIQHAKEKLKRKNLDAIFVNPVTSQSSSALPSGFGSSTNHGHWISAQGIPSESPLLQKRDLGHWILDQIKKDLVSS